MTRTPSHRLSATTRVRAVIKRADLNDDMTHVEIAISRHLHLHQTSKAVKESMMPTTTIPTIRCRWTLSHTMSCLQAPEANANLSCLCLTLMH
ncbi:Hypothetical protein FKW44_015508 [Caligus rogercresseyi]|uniref:Uncharacterized protein n=1 Tax=Caligus rogercresseyi TaxID=217165 RepID=A0A7T8JZS8_CALRO|nr:Hypothetical protein FKW44_015508 [Caligus rogercresseyi]